MQCFTPILIALALLSVPACDSGPAKPEPAKVAITPPAPVTPPPVVEAELPPPADLAPPSAESPQGKVALAAVVAREISGAPDRADEILGKHGLDRNGLDILMLEIAGDPDLTRAYMAARRG